MNVPHFISRQKLNKATTLMCRPGATKDAVNADVCDGSEQRRKESKKKCQDRWLFDPGILYLTLYDDTTRKRRPYLHPPQH